MSARTTLLDHAKAVANFFSLRQIVRELKFAPSRAKGLQLLATISVNNSPDSHIKRILIDGTWDNPNYWYRYALVRRALNLAAGEEVGLIGRWRRRHVRDAFRRFGAVVRDLPSSHRPSAEYLVQARAMLANVQAPDELRSLVFPEGYPWEIFYDGVLKRQLRGSVDVFDPMLPHYLAEQLAAIDAARAVLREQKFDLIVLSHCINFELGALAWMAIRTQIPAIVLYGDFGQQRFMKIRNREELFDFVNRPTPEELRAMPDAYRSVLRCRGEAYFTRRFIGESGDLGARYAHRATAATIDRNSIAAGFGWDAEKPIICVYASNWFDFPHSCRIENFLDFQDWINATLAVAKETPGVNWLFKPHPCDTWYAAPKGPTLSQLVAAADVAHVRTVPQDWASLALMEAINGAVTYLGTIGVELGALGKPVLVADEGWYGSHGFVINPGGRDEYLQTLRREWWLEPRDVNVTKSRALEFAGAYFCQPDWQRSLVLEDDSNQDAIFTRLPEFLETHGEQLQHEIDLIRQWMDSSLTHYHTFKIQTEASGYAKGAETTSATEEVSE